MRLFIAENPVLGERLPMFAKTSSTGGMVFIKCGNDDVVTWCVGHLLEQAEPDAYDPKFNMAFRAFTHHS